MKIRKDIQKAESQIEGERQGVRIVAFLQGLNEHNIPLDGLFLKQKKKKNYNYFVFKNFIIFF